MYNDAVATLNLIMYPIIIMAAIAFRIGLKDKSDFCRRLPFMIISVGLLCAEAGKQIYGIAIGEYNLFWLPFHICTIVIVGFAVISFKNPDKTTSKIFWCLTLSTGLLVSLAVIIAPYPIIGYAATDILDGTADYIAWYSVSAHYALILLFAMGISLNMYTPEFKDIVWSIVMWVGSLIIIVSFANIFQINYANFLEFKLPFLDVGKLGIPLFQTILFLGYVVVYALGAVGLYGYARLKDRMSGPQVVDIQAWG